MLAIFMPPEYIVFWCGALRRRHSRWRRHPIFRFRALSSEPVEGF